MSAETTVTQREYHFPADATLMSTTDVHSHIRYANAAFVDVSGFEAEALMGAPHKLVRHPDMPRQAFADLWATLRSGHAWTALVKNRRRDGDHYWVRANVAPLRRGGEIDGFLSVRTRPTRDEVDGAEDLYRRFREGRAQGLAFHRGLVVRQGWQRWRNLLKTASVSTRIRLALWPLWASLPALAWLSGLGAWPQLAAWAAASALPFALADAWLQRQIAAPLRLLGRQAADVATGQFDADRHLPRVDELGMAMRSVNQAGLNVRALVADVGDQVGGLLAVAEQVRSASGELGTRAEQAAASLADTAAALTELTASVGHNAQSAGRASEAADAMAAAAAQASERAAEVEAVMQQISQATGRIGDIVGLIDDIAFQTNLLALNAAVEAARAGSGQGRGFAVVAAQVRALAQRSQAAAGEIKGLIASSAEWVQMGAQLSARSGRSTAELLAQARDVTGAINAISAACREQAAGIEAIGQRIEALDTLTRQNAAMAEDSSAASGRLRQQAEWLARAVDVFRHG